MPELRQYILATAGHVDHGKSSLVKALTGTDPDRLPEEKARGITIDLGFAHLKLPAPGIELSIGIVDVPGHEDFVKNMVAGVGAVDLALFVIAADDCWMPQTEEHFQILTYLGIRRAVVALTKIDLAARPEPEIVAEIRAKLAGSDFASAPIIPTSVVSGRGLEELRASLASSLMGATPAPDLKKPRLPIDRVFTLRGIGAVVTGSLTGGALKRGQNIVIQPGGLSTRLRAIQSFYQEVESVLPGTRVALNIPDVPIAAEGSQGLKRGDIITVPELGKASDTIDALVTRSSRRIREGTAAPKPIKSGTTLRWHHGSASVEARIFFLDDAELPPGGSAIAQLRFEQPVFILAGEKFLLRDSSEQQTLAGGVALDVDADRRRFRTPAQRLLLEARAARPLDPATYVLSEIQRAGYARPPLLVKSVFSSEVVQQTLASLAADKHLVLMDGLVAHAPWWNSLLKQAASLVDNHHRRLPEQAGMPINQLRSALPAEASAIFDPLLKALLNSGFQQGNALVGRATHKPALPPELQRAGAKVRATLSAKPLDPPSRKEAAPDVETQKALRFLIQTQQAVELGDEVVLLAENYTRAVEIVRNFLRQRQAATVSEIRQALGASRRIVVPLLERMDKEGYTRREGDQRRLKG